MNDKNFSIVTEAGGEPVSRAQIDRFVQRYLWAGSLCQGGDSLEVACGTGPGLGYLASVSRSLLAGDYSAEVLRAAVRHYGERIPLIRLDGQSLPLAALSLDTVILFEAIYYIPDIGRFLAECARVLRPGGKLLIATANRDLYDFNPSPFSVRYLNPPELDQALRDHGFSAQFFGGSPVNQNSMFAHALRWVKRFAVRWNLIPGSMHGKRLLKRLVFGKLVLMPVELKQDNAIYEAPTPINGSGPDRVHQVIYCVATKF